MFTDWQEFWDFTIMDLSEQDEIVGVLYGDAIRSVLRNFLVAADNMGVKINTRHVDLDLQNKWCWEAIHETPYTHNSYCRVCCKKEHDVLAEG